MPLLHVIAILVIVGLLLWAVNAIIPMDATIKKIINVIAIVAVCIWLISLFVPGLGLSSVHVGR